MAEDGGTWVYAVAGQQAHDWLAGAAGVGGQPVHAVSAAGLTAAVSPVSLAEYGEEALRRNLEDLTWLEAVARAHHAVIDAAARHAPVLPMRLATVYHGEARVRAMLEHRAAEFTAALDRISGRAEWGIKVLAAPARTAAGPAGAEQAGEPERPGAAYLRRRREQLAARHESQRAGAEAAEHIHAALSREVTAALLRRPQSPQLSPGAEGMILNAAYLVDNERATAFRRLAEDLARRYPEVRLELTGPWPAYSFATTAPLTPAGAAVQRAGRAGTP